MDVMEELSKRSEYDELGIDYELVLNEQGIPVAKIKEEMSTLESVGQGLQRVGAAGVGTVAGVLGATAGLPTDLVGLINGIKDAVSAEDGKKLDAFSKGFSEFSKGGIIPGSEFYKELWDKTVDSLETYSPEMKEDAKAGFSFGEFFDVAGPVGVGIAKAPQIIKGTKKKLEQVGESAQKRLDADKGSVAVSSMGVGEMGKMVDKGLSKLAPTEGKVVDLKPKTDRLNFYSKAEEVTNQLKQNKGTGQQYRQQLLKAGVKPDEIEWLGLDDVLNKGKITKQEIQDQINANRIELDEVELKGNDARGGMSNHGNLSQRFLGGEKDDFTSDEKGRAVYTFVDPKTGYVIKGGNDQGYEIFRSEADMKDGKNYLQRNFGRGRQSIASFDEAVIQAEQIMVDEGLIEPSRKKTAKYEEYTEPGGYNYREFLIKYNNPKVSFDEGHFDEENVIAHFRTKDRKTSDGKKVFYIEEIQSDWGQQGRDEGFLLSKKELEDIDLKLADAQLKYKDLLNTFTIKQGNKQIPFTDWYVSRRKELATSEDVKKQLDDIDFMVTETDFPLQMRNAFKDQVSANFIFKNGKQVRGLRDSKFMKEVYDLQEQINFYQNDPLLRNIPKAPFITNTDKWTQLTLKRILSRAVDEGYDFVSITPGKAQMDRWNDEGVAKFYDEIVPKNAEKIVKKLDRNAIQKDKEINIPSPFKSVRELHSQTEREFGKRPKKRFSIELTPQLKEKVKKGMAMFSATPLVVGQENE